MQKSKLSVGLLLLAVVMVVETAGAIPPPHNAPDVGSSALLLSTALGGLALVRKFIR
jgi:hypothetical protein